MPVGRPGSFFGPPNAMPLLLSILAASAVTTVPECSWNHPGRDPYRGDIAAAVDAYGDIPPATRERLKTRLRQHDFDDDVVITRDSIVGRDAYDARIRGMHFGASRVCKVVDRSGWTADHREAGRVVCEDGHCLLLPAVCGNLSVVSRAQRQQAAAEEFALPTEPTAAGGPGATAAPPMVEPADAQTFASTSATDLLPPVVAVASEAPITAPPPVWSGIPMPVGGPPVIPVIDVPSPIPEPSSLALFAGGAAWLALALAWRGRKQGR
jgi:hypothetical protein